MLLTLLLVLLLLIIIYVLLVPIKVFINSTSNEYYVHIRGLGKVSIEEDVKEIIRIHIQVFWFGFNLYPFKERRPKSSKERKKRKSNNVRQYALNMKRLTRVLRSFRVRRLYVDIDSGDCISNSKLYPLFALLDHRFGGFHINFEGRNELLLCLENRPINMVRSIINI